MPKFLRPVVGGVVSQRYGARPEYYRRFGLKYHEGTDVAVPVGTPVFAPAAGVVHEAHRINDVNYGIHVRTLHLIDGECYMIILAHLSEILPEIEKGVSIQYGQVIGLSGNTGRSTGPHLHTTVKMFDASRRGLADQATDIMNSDRYFDW